MNNLPVRLKDISGVPATGHILMMDISGYPEYGFFLRDMVICGRHHGGDMKPACMDFIPDTGVLMSDIMEAYITDTDIMELDS
jgi:hypothetical protein